MTVSDAKKTSSSEGKEDAQQKSRRNLPAEAYAYWEKQGVDIIPVAYGERRPTGPRAMGWPTRVYTAENFLPNDNAGLRFKGNQACIDVDNPLFGKLLWRHVQRTLPHMLSTIKENADSPNHHFAIITDMPPEGTLNYKMVEDHGNKHGNLTAEILRSKHGEGHQALIPPSYYADTGQRLLWTSGTEFGGTLATYAWDEVDTVIGWCVAATELSYYWTKNIRHKLSNALAGFLIRHEWDEEKVKAFIADIAWLANDDDASGRFTNVDTTAQRIYNDQPATGGKILAELLGSVGGRVLMNVCKHLHIDGGYAFLPVQMEGYPPLIVSEVIECLFLNEEGDALLCEKLYKDRLIYDTDMGKWFWFSRERHRWEEDDGEVHSQVMHVLAKAYDTASSDVLESYGNAIAKAKDDDERKKLEAACKSLTGALTKRANALRTRHRITDVLRGVGGRKAMKIRHSAWNANPTLLCVRNGILDPRTGEVRAGTPKDYNRYGSETVWCGLDHPAPRFERALQEIFADRTDENRALLISFLARLFGSAISGTIKEQRFTELYGEHGQNGKDLIIGAIYNALGREYATPTVKELFLKQRTINHAAADPVIANLEGKRLVWASEPDEGERFDMGRVKDMSSPAPKIARRLFENGHEFTPTHKLFLLTNHKPHADAGDNAFWSRIFLIEFRMHFTTAAKIKETNDRVADPDLADALKEEASGILAWLVRGYMDWVTQDYNPPPEIDAAGEQYRQDEDTLALYIAERLNPAEGSKIAAADLYSNYEVWAGKKSAMSPLAFGKKIKKHIKPKRFRSGIYYLDYELAQRHVGLKSQAS